MNRALGISAAIVSALYLFLSKALPFPGGAILKTSMCVLLAVLALRHKSVLLAVALGFSAAGDALLAIDGARLFVPALSSFLVTHGVYAAIFVRASRDAPIALGASRRIGMILPIVFAIGYSIVLWPRLGDLVIPVLVYIAAIVAMAVLSFRVPQMIVPLGALLFMASDSLISLEKFLWTAEWMGPLVWITYALAQQLITHGLIRARTREP
jgi:uncharacterized membrane protein YhhN